MKQILIIEDNEFVSQFVTNVGKKIGAGVSVISDGRKAKILLPKATHVDLIILDLHLPYTPGWELLEIIQSCPNICNTPVVIMSSAPIPPKAKENLSQRVTAYLDKDTLNFAEFETFVRKLLWKEGPDSPPAPAS